MPHPEQPEHRPTIFGWVWPPDNFWVGLKMKCKSDKNVV